jgi:hypothetical protein
VGKGCHQYSRNTDCFKIRKFVGKSNSFQLTPRLRGAIRSRIKKTSIPDITRRGGAELNNFLLSISIPYSKSKRASLRPMDKKIKETSTGGRHDSLL